MAKFWKYTGIVLTVLIVVGYLAQRNQEAYYNKGYNDGLKAKE